MRRWKQPWKTKHHLTPKSRGGTHEDGVLVLWRDRHDLWHKLFQLRGQAMTLEEIHEAIHRIMRVKRRTRCEDCSD